MPIVHPAEWGWKCVKYHFTRSLSPSEIVQCFQQKHRCVGTTWVRSRIKNYRLTGNPNAKADSSRRNTREATRLERKWLKRELLRNPVQFFDQLQTRFKRK